MTQGAPRKTSTTSKTRTADVIDLDRLLAARATKPKTVRLGGRDWTVRADLTAEEVVEFWAMHNMPAKPATGGEQEPSPAIRAFGMLFGGVDTALEFDAIVETLPAQLSLELYRRVLSAAGLRIHVENEDEESEGESSAS